MLIKREVRRALMERSDRSCEAMIQGINGVWFRCWTKPVEIHHLLTKGRGGGVLDDTKETYHLICLCRKHHAASDGEEAYINGLLIDGYVVTERGRPVYYGKDRFLKERYPQ